MSRPFAVEWIPAGLVGPPRSIAGVRWTFETERQARAFAALQLERLPYMREHLYFVDQTRDVSAPELIPWSTS